MIWGWKIVAFLYPMPHIHRHTRTLACDNRGVTAIEFAMIAPVFVLMLMGIIEFSLVMFVSSVMEGATGMSARYGKTGYVAAGSTRQQQIVATVAARTAGLLDPSKISITSTVYSAFDKVNKPEPYTDSNGNHSYTLGEPYTDINGNGQWDEDMGAAGLGNAGDVVVYSISYPWTINTPIMTAFLGNIFTITSRTVVKNEPY